VFFDNMEVPAENLIGEKGQGFRYILGGMNMAASASPRNTTSNASSARRASTWWRRSRRI
jgi:alkylation response protein AidB-like acyl-CoA dehydrogenase